MPDDRTAEASSRPTQNRPHPPDNPTAVTVPSPSANVADPAVAPTRMPGPAVGQDRTSVRGPGEAVVEVTNPSSHPTPAPGPAVTPPPGYELLGVLGHGGMGVVYKARQTALKREVALKVMLAGAHASDSQRQRFLAEAEAVASVSHPGVVQVHDFGTSGDQPFLALEFCHGGSLAGRLGGAPLPPREAAVLVEQVAHGVAAAHARGSSTGT